MEKKLHVDYITYKESGQIVAYAPQLELCFDASTKEKSLESLEMGSKALFDFWKTKNILEEKITSLGLNGTITPAQRESIQRDISIPYFILKQDTRDEGSIDITVKL